MLTAPGVATDLADIPHVNVRHDVLLSEYTRFGIGGPAALYAESSDESAFVEALRCVKRAASLWVVIGNGTNLIVADSGFPGVVLRFTNSDLRADGSRIYAGAGTLLQDVVDSSVTLGLSGIHTMTGIPGCTGAAVYGNAGAYGRSIAQSVVEVRFFDGDQVRVLDRRGCEFAYRESIFKRNKSWIIFSVLLELEHGDSEELRNKASEILTTRNRKYPPTMKCAGSIFKNLLLAELPDPVRSQLPANVIIEGKVPSAYFLEQVGAKGMTNGDIRVADYHANLIYNTGQGTAEQLRTIIAELKRRVVERFAFVLEEEVQYVGFTPT
jgi:UDP-N-acetylmuramate dehydrogenase